MKVSEVMTRNVATIDAAESIATAAREMMEKDVGVLPVIHGRETVGIVTDRDIAVRALAAGLGGDTPVSKVMSSELAWCAPDDELDVVLGRMASEQVRRMPVLDSKGHLAGIVTLGDAARKDPHHEEVTEALVGISRTAGHHCQSLAFA